MNVDLRTLTHTHAHSRSARTHDELSTSKVATSAVNKNNSQQCCQIDRVTKQHNKSLCDYHTVIAPLWYKNNNKIKFRSNVGSTQDIDNTDKLFIIKTIKRL